MGAFAMQIAGLKSSLHARVPRAGKSSCENKDVGRTGSRALYAARRGAVNRERARAIARSARIDAPQVVDNCGAAFIRLAITPWPSRTINFSRAPVAENSAVYSSLWMQCARALEAELSEQQFNTWIRPLQPVEDGALLKLLAPNRFVVDWVKTHCLDADPRMVDASWRRRRRRSRSRSAAGRRRGATRRRAPNPRRAAAAVDALLGGRLNPDFTFDDFVEGKSNQLARAAALQVGRESRAAPTTRCSSTAASASARRT